MIANLLGSGWRYFRLYGHFLAFSFSKGFEFRFDFWMRIIMDLCYYAIAIAFYRILYVHTGVLGGWNEAQAMVFVSGYLIVDAINMTVFSGNLWQLPFLINKGELDYYLVRPVSSLFFVSLRDFAASSFVNLIFAFGIFGWAVVRLVPFPGLARIALFLFLLLNGSVIFFCLNFLANTLVIWTHSSRGFGELVWSMAKFSERPDGIYRGWVRLILVSILPFAVISSFPAHVVLEALNWKVVFHMVAVTGAFLTILIMVWNRALKSYSSASS